MPIAESPFTVDSACIDCDQCRQIAPATFRASGGRTAVRRQPAGPDETHRAALALVTCPTGAIHAAGEARQAVRDAVASLPEAVTPDGSVLFCGYASESSFGASSYLIRRPEGNVLVDSPRFASPLVRRLEELGGVALMVLTHRDDVADQFSGDHLAFDPEAGALVAWRDVCWWDWDAQVRSLARLLDLRFEWLLPGHGHRHHAPAAEMRRALAALVSGLRSPRAARAGVRMAP